MTTAKERAQKSARSGLQKGLTGLVFGVALMFLINSGGNTFMFVAAAIGVLGALLYTVASIMAIRMHR